MAATVNLRAVFKGYILNSYTNRVSILLIQKQYYSFLKTLRFVSGGVLSFNTSNKFGFGVRGR